MSGREAQIDRARDAFYRGFVAEAIGAYLRNAEVMDGEGMRRKGVLTADDMAGWSAGYDAPVSVDYGGWTVNKTGAWGQGPVLLQTLQMLGHTGIAEMEPGSTEFIHTSVEALKLAMADREAYYGDPEQGNIPLASLLSDDYAKARAALISASVRRAKRSSSLPRSSRL